MTDRLAEIAARVEAQRGCTDSQVSLPFIHHAREDIPWLLARVRELEAGLAEYGQHKDGCMAIGYGDPINKMCSCGLAELTDPIAEQAKAEQAKQEKEAAERDQLSRGIAYLIRKVHERQLQGLGDEQ